MITTVQCPSCDTSFPVDTDKVPEGGVNARCSVCPAVFRVDPPADVEAAGAPEAAEEPEATPDWGMEIATPEVVEEPGIVREPPAAEATPRAAETEAPGAAEEPEPVAHRGTEGTSEVEEAVEVEASWDDEEEAPTRTEEARSGEEDVFTPSWDTPGPDAGTVEAEPFEAEPFDAEPFDADVPGRETVEPRPLDTDEPGPGTVEAEVEETPPFEIRTPEAGPAGAEVAEPPAREPGSPATAGAGEPPTDEAELSPSPGPDVPAGAEMEVVEPELDTDSLDPSAGAVPETVPAPSEPPTGFQFGKRDPHEKAQRLARVLVSDMIMYNPERHGRALDGGTLKEDFEDEIRKSWDEYVEQVGEELATDTTYFSDALNDILARGERVFEGNPPN